MTEIARNRDIFMTNCMSTAVDTWLHRKELNPGETAMQCFVEKCRQAGRAAVLFLLSTMLHAQTPGTGAISGTIADPSGAVLAKAAVSVINEATHAVRETQTSADGAF